MTDLDKAVTLIDVFFGQEHDIPVTLTANVSAS